MKMRNRIILSVIAGLFSTALAGSAHADDLKLDAHISGYSSENPANYDSSTNQFPPDYLEEINACKDDAATGYKNCSTAYGNDNDRCDTDRISCNAACKTFLGGVDSDCINVCLSEKVNCSIRASNLWIKCNNSVNKDYLMCVAAVKKRFNLTGPSVVPGL